MNDYTYNEFGVDGEIAGNTSVFSYCDHCGFAIENAREALIVKVNGERIHESCYAEYMEERMFDFVCRATGNEHRDCEF